MPLPRPPGAYDARDQERTRDEIDRQLEDCLKRGQDVELIDGRLILQSPDGTRWAMGVSNAGATTWTAI